MRVVVQSGAIEKIVSDLIVVNLFEETTAASGTTGAVDRALGGAIRELIGSGDLTGEEGKTAVLYPRGAVSATRVLIVGLGRREKFGVHVVRRVAAAVAREVQRLHVTSYDSVLHGAGAGGITIEQSAQAIVEGTMLGAYAFTEHKTQREGLDQPLESLGLVVFGEEGIAEAQRGAQAGQWIAESVCLARDLANQPANYLTPTLLAEVAQQAAAEVGLTCRVLEEQDMAELGMGALLGVAQGSEEPAKMVILEHNPDRDDLDTLVVVGKGITFDSGGISLKPGAGMHEMKDDMSGAAIALATLRAAALLNLPLHVVGLLPATENLPGGRAYKPGDVLESMSGLTIEVINTDAEGRLILADALSYAEQFQPKAVVDLATLTGACVVALGHVACGLMGQDPSLIGALKTAATESDEKIWQLPLYEEYAEQIKSDVADVKNTGGRPAGAITAGLFLSKFASAYPWAHLDIAGTSWTDKTKGYQAKGGTGFGVRLLVQWLRDMSSVQQD